MLAREPASPKLTDAGRHERFKDVAREVEASEDSEDFGRTFDAITRPDCRPHRSDPQGFS